jgi:hypothetical protein
VERQWDRAAFSPAAVVNAIPPVFHVEHEIDMVWRPGADGEIMLA